jgi:hypothetical protein
MGNRDLILSYITIRRTIGILGILLPVICLSGGYFLAHEPPKSSISLYYYTNMHDVFVGILFMVSIFLVTYEDELKFDDFLTTVIGFAGFGIVIFPCKDISNSLAHVGTFQLASSVSDLIHIISASIFFLLLGFNSIFIFTRKKSGLKSDKRNELIRDFIYITCGVIILICMSTLIICYIVQGECGFNNSNMPIIFESIMLFAFGISWLIKGETFYKDREEKLQ